MDCDRALKLTDSTARAVIKNLSMLTGLSDSVARAFEGGAGEYDRGL